MICSYSYPLATLYLELSTTALFGLKIIVTEYRSDYLNAELLKNLSAVNLIQVIHYKRTFFREHNEMGLNFEHSV